MDDVQNELHDDGSVLAVCDGPVDDGNQRVVKVVDVEVGKSFSTGPHLIANL